MKWEQPVRFQLPLERGKKPDWTGLLNIINPANEERPQPGPSQILKWLQSPEYMCSTLPRKWRHINVRRKAHLAIDSSDSDHGCAGGPTAPLMLLSTCSQCDLTSPDVELGLRVMMMICRWYDHFACRTCNHLFSHCSFTRYHDHDLDLDDPNKPSHIIWVLRNIISTLRNVRKGSNKPRTSLNKLYLTRTSLECPQYPSTSSRDTFETWPDFMWTTYESSKHVRYIRNCLEQIRSSSDLLWMTFPRICSLIVIIGPSYHPSASHGTCIKPRTMSYIAYLKDMGVFSIFSDSSKGTWGSTYGNNASFASFDHVLSYLAPFRQLHMLHCLTHGDIS
jgi:hypothetical protein